MEKNERIDNSMKEPLDKRLNTILEKFVNENNES